VWLTRRQRNRKVLPGIASLADDSFSTDSGSSSPVSPGYTSPFGPGTYSPPPSSVPAFNPSIIPSLVTRPGSLPPPVFNPGNPNYGIPAGPFVPGYAANQNAGGSQPTPTPGITIPGFTPMPGIPGPSYQAGPQGATQFLPPTGPSSAVAVAANNYDMPFSPAMQAILDANATSVTSTGSTQPTRPVRPTKPIRVPVYKPPKAPRPAPMRPVARPVYTPPSMLPTVVPPTPAYIPPITVPTTYTPPSLPSIHIPVYAPPIVPAKPLPQLPTFQFQPPVYQPQGDKQPNIPHVDDSTLPSVVSSGVTFVFFHGPNCGPCNSMIPLVEQLARANAGRANVVDYFVTSGNRQQYSKYSDLGYPSYVVFKNGVPVNTVVGSISQNAHVGKMSAAQLQSQIDQAGTSANGPEQLTYVAPTLPVPVAPVYVPPAPQPIFTSGPTNAGTGCQHVTDSTFASMNGPGITTIVIFHARWCGHCPSYMKYADRVANEYRVNGVMNGNVRILEADVDDSPRLANGVTSVPSSRVYQNGVQVASSDLELYKFNQEYPAGTPVPNLAPGVVPAFSPPPVTYTQAAPVAVANANFNPANFTYVILDGKPAYQDHSSGHVIREAEYNKLAAPKTGAVAAGKLKSDLTTSIKNADNSFASIGSILDKVQGYGDSAAHNIWNLSQSKQIATAPFVSSGSGAPGWPVRSVQARPALPQIPSTPIPIATRPNAAPEFQSASQTTPISATAASLDAVSASGEAFAAKITGGRAPSPLYPDSPLSPGVIPPEFASNTATNQALVGRAKDLRAQIDQLAYRTDKLGLLTKVDKLAPQYVSSAFVLPGGSVKHDAVYDALKAIKPYLMQKFSSLKSSGVDLKDPVVLAAVSRVQQKWMPVITDFAMRANGDVDNPLREFSASGANSWTDREGYNYAQNEARSRFEDQKARLLDLTGQAVSDLNTEIDNARLQLMQQRQDLLSQLQTINAQLPVEQQPVQQKSWLSVVANVFGVNH
jgi:thiol-disulfide isomerase/thioredoxin